MNKRQLSLFPDATKYAKNNDRKVATKVRSKNEYVSSIWSFSEASDPQLYRWYGTLPRSLVQRLISIYARKDSRILDPFMGTGTTVELAAEAGLSVVGVDSNPLSCLISETRLYHDIPKQSVLQEADKIAEKLGLLAFSQEKKDKRLFETYLSDGRYRYTKKWFRKDSLDALLTLLFAIADLHDTRVQRLLFVAAAQTIRDVASVDPRCTHHLVTKKREFIDPVPLWLQQVKQCLVAIRETKIDNSKISIIQGSALEYAPEKYEADFVLIHPPYLGMIHYHLIHRLATDLLEIVRTAKAPIALTKYDFRYERIRKMDISTDNSDQYKLFIRTLAQAMQRIASPNGCCAVVIGDQRYKGRLRHPFTDFVNLFEGNGFTLEENFIWILQNNAGMHILRRGHFIDHNYIMIFRKGIGQREGGKPQSV